MGRSTTKSKTTAHRPSTVTVSLPEEKEAPPDERMVGFFFPHDPHATPLDFKTDPHTGLRQGKQESPWEVANHSLLEGIVGAVLPPLFIWKNGIWLSDIHETDWPIKDINLDPTVKLPKKTAETPEWMIWVTHGEGTPGGYWFRCYLLPHEISVEQQPKHPLLWLPALKEGKAATFKARTASKWAHRSSMPFRLYHESWDLLDKGFVEIPSKYGIGPLPTSASYYNPAGFGQPKTLLPPKPTEVKATAAPSLPAGVRFRCQCGHWYKESDLPAHAKVCAVIQGGENTADWAIMCDDKCGCEMIKGFPSETHALGHKTLDHVSRCKPGFPRQAKEVTMTTTEQEPLPETEEDEPEETNTEPPTEAETTEA